MHHLANRPMGHLSLKKHLGERNEPILKCSKVNNSRDHRISRTDKKAIRNNVYPIFTYHFVHAQEKPITKSLPSSRVQFKNIPFQNCEVSEISSNSCLKMHSNEVLVSIFQSQIMGSKCPYKTFDKSRNFHSQHATWLFIHNAEVIFKKSHTTTHQAVSKNRSNRKHTPFHGSTWAWKSRGNTRDGDS